MVTIGKFLSPTVFFWQDQLWLSKRLVKFVFSVSLIFFSSALPHPAASPPVASLIPRATPLWTHS